MSVEFEPVPLKPGRRRVDPVLVGALVVVLGIGAAILKPWDDGPVERSPAPTAELAGVPSPDVTGVPTRPPLAASRSVVGELSWRRVSPVVEDRDEWGIRVIVVDPQPDGHDGSIRRYAEHWVAAERGAMGPMGSSEVTVIPPRGVPVVALGVTTPTAELPLDVRLWQVTPSGSLVWLDARPVDGVAAQGALLFQPPIRAGRAADTWVPGAYRMDLLTATGVSRLTVLLPDSRGLVPLVDPAPQGDEPALERPFNVGLERLRAGSFVMIGGAGHALSGAAGPPLDEHDAWLDTEPGTGRRPVSRVSRTHAPEVTSMGVRLPDDARVSSAVLRRLVPGPLQEEARVAGLSAGGGPSPWVAFRPVRQLTWERGVYAMDVVWRDASGEHEATWHVELGPGAIPPPLALRAARDWARFAGREGLVVGMAEALVGGPWAATIRFLEGYRPPERPRGGDPFDDCGGTGIDGRPPLVGVTFRPNRAPHRIDLVRLFPDGSEERVPVLTAPALDDGLAVVAPGDGPTFVPGVYRLDLEFPDGIERAGLCIRGPGMSGGLP